MSLRERKKEQTRSALAGAIVELSRVHGYDAVTIDDVVGEAVVSRRTFHRYFDTKEAAFFASHIERLERFEAELARPLPEERPYDRVRRCLLALAGEYDLHCAEETARHLVIQGSRALLAYELQLDLRYEEAIVRALEAPEDSEAELTRHAVMGAAVFGVVRAVLRRWFEAPRPGTLRPMGAHALDLLEVGFAHRRGIVIPLRTV